MMLKPGRVLLQSLQKEFLNLSLQIKKVSHIKIIHLTPRHMDMHKHASGFRFTFNKDKDELSNI